MMKIVKSKSRANPPTHQEIIAARKALEDIFCRCVDDDPVPPVMDCWKGQGWHKDEIYIGILIGLEIARARRNKQEVER
jgi:hypothetical protein